MNSEIIKTDKNPFLNREEILLEIKSKSTPSLEEIKKEIKGDENLVVIRKVHSNFGKQRFLAEILIYNSIEDREKVETIPKKIKKKLAEEKKKREAEEAKKKAEEKKAAEEAEAKAKEESEKPVKEAPAEEKPAEEEKPEEPIKEKPEEKTE